VTARYTRLPPPIRYFLFIPTPPTELYTLSLHDALPIWAVTPPAPAARTPRRAARTPRRAAREPAAAAREPAAAARGRPKAPGHRSEEHTSELQSRENLVCRLLLEKKKKIKETSR